MTHSFEKPSKKEVAIVTFSASAALGLGYAALTLIRHHRNSGDRVIIETTGEDVLQPVDAGVETVKKIKKLSGHTIYLGPEDKIKKARRAYSVNGINVPASAEKVLKLIRKTGGSEYRENL